MKKILITGPNGYIAKNCYRFLIDKGYDVELISVKNNNWQDASFAKYDVLIHLAAFVHHRENKKNADNFFIINRDLTLRLASKAKNEGVKVFIFMSTMSVYDTKNEKIITNKTKPNPKTNYGLSKLEAEDGLKKIWDTNFKIAIIRSPIIFGPGCKGNYNRLSNFIKRVAFFPNITNKRSMLFITNLCQFIHIVISKNIDGMFYPQDKEYYSVNDLVKTIRLAHKKNIWFIPLSKKTNAFLCKVFKIWAKLFNTLIFSKEMSDIDYGYHSVTNEDTIRITEGK